MEIIRQGAENYSKRDIYNMTRSPEVQKLRDAVGATLDIDKYVVYTDKDSNGNDQTILAFTTKAGDIYGTNSSTARKEFEYIADLMEGEEFAIKVIEGQSKAGRTYITVALV